MRKSHLLRFSLSLLLSSLLLTQTGSAAPLSPLPPVHEADGSLGLCYAFYDDPWMQLAANAGARWDRFDFRWNATEVSSGYYEFSGHEAILNRYAALGIPMNIVGILGSPAVWAADCPAVIQRAPQPLLMGHPRNDPVGWRPCPPKELKRAWDDPENLWARYVETVVGHFKGRVDVWEIWNEPDLTGFWLGTPEEYAQLLKVGYLAAKHANPDATVLFGGLAYWGNPTFYQQVLDLLAADPQAAAYNAYFDVMSLHLYSNVYQAHDIAAQVKAAVDATVGPHPLWLTETGVPIWDEDQPTTPWPPFYSATAAEAAAYVIETYANARATGVERLFIFRLHDDYGGMGERYGITRDDHSLRPAYIAYQVAARYLRDAEEVIGPFRGRLHRVSFLSAAHGRTDVVWNPAPVVRTLQQPAFSASLTLITHEGLTTTLVAEAGTYRISLAPATANQNPEGLYMIGGPPVLLAYGDLGDTQPPVSALHALPANTLAGTLSLTWEAADTQTGYWYTEIQAARNSDGPWDDLAGPLQTVGRFSFDATDITQDGVWYFRARARDQAGNWEAWPTTAEISTTLYSTQPVRLVTVTISAFSDADGDGTQDPAESTLDGVSFLWRDATGAEVDRGNGGVWEATHEVPLGSYEILVLHPAYLTARRPFTVGTALEPFYLEQHVGLLLVRGQSFLPLVLKQHP